ncbi:MAG: DUF5671 domain-containing protein, partial [Chloroflexota bacterium]|nr:DUF5671 domain-containing protein [Chloroflexota bacterium]
MGTTRRLYLYTVSLISLTVLAVGLFQLVEAVVITVLDALGPGTLLDDGAADRGRFSLAIALVVVGLPLFLSHWLLAERGARGDGASSGQDRRSAIRAFHIAFVQAVAMVVIAIGAMGTIEWILGLALGADTFGTVADELAMALVVTPIWVYHGWLRGRNLRTGHLAGAAAWWSRLYRYGAAYFGSLALMFGLSSLIATVLRMLIGPSDFGGDADWWRRSLSGAVAATLVGTAVWWIHWRDAQLVVADTEAIGEDDRDTRLRATYFGAVLLTTVSVVAFHAASVIGEIGRWLLGVAEWSGTSAFLETVVGPPIATIPFIAGAWLSGRAHLREATGRGAAARAATEGLTLHLVALVGLTFLAFGLAQLGGLLVQTVLGVSDNLFNRAQVPWHAAQALVGLALWLPSWAAILRRRTGAGRSEGETVVSRAYLYLVVGAALIVGVPSAAFVLYRTIDAALGG